MLKPTNKTTGYFDNFPLSPLCFRKLNRMIGKSMKEPIE